MAKLTKKEGDLYQKRLIEEQTRINGDVSSMEREILKNSQRDLSGDLSGYSLHPADAGSDNYDREFTLDLMNKEQDILYEIHDALERIKSGEFGKCEICGSAIGKTRLKAKVYARYCITCKEKSEKKTK